jgi:hypothetical protein
MAQWRIRNPDDFPPLFHRAMQQGPGVDKLVWEGVSLDSARHMQKKFRVFRACLRAYPSHISAGWEFRLNHRTRLECEPLRGKWKVLLTSRPSALSELENAKDLGIPIDRLGRLP